MKIEKLTENKIRIILDFDELAKKNIDFISLTKNTDVAHKLFKKILKQAEKEVDFHIEDCKLLIEAFISSDGFFIITFTKIADETNTKKSVKVKIKKPAIHSKSKTNIYQFSCFDEFCNFCTYLNNCNLPNLKSISKNISLYEYNSKYYLVLTNINCDDLFLFNTYISEFATNINNSPSFLGKLSEYGKVIFKNYAIKNGIKFFVKK